MNCGGSVGPATYFFVTDGQKCDYLSRASQRARGALNSRGLCHCSDFNLVVSSTNVADRQMDGRFKIIKTFRNFF